MVFEATTGLRLASTVLEFQSIPEVAVVIPYIERTTCIRDLSRIIRDIFANAGVAHEIASLFASDMSVILHSFFRKYSVLPNFAMEDGDRAYTLKKCNSKRER